THAYIYTYSRVSVKPIYHMLHSLVRYSYKCMTTKSLLLRWVVSCCGKHLKCGGNYSGLLTNPHIWQMKARSHSAYLLAYVEWLCLQTRNNRTAKIAAEINVKNVSRND